MAHLQREKNALRCKVNNAIIMMIISVTILPVGRETTTAGINLHLCHNDDGTNDTREHFLVPSARRRDRSTGTKRLENPLGSTKQNNRIK